MYFQTLNALTYVPKFQKIRIEILAEVRNNFIPVLGNTVTVMSPDGKPVQINSSALQAAAAQNAVGR